MFSKQLKYLSGLVLAAGMLFGAQSIPSGTVIKVRNTSLISSKNAKSGDTWRGTLGADVKAGGETVARRGDNVEGKITDAQSSGRLSKPGFLKLEVTSVNGQSVNTNAWETEGGSHKKRNIGSALGGGALGAAIGALAGGGKGAAIGAGAGAAAGTAGAAATGKKDVEIPSETMMTFTID